MIEALFSSRFLGYFPIPISFGGKGKMRESIEQKTDIKALDLVIYAYTNPANTCPLSLVPPSLPASSPISEHGTPQRDGDAMFDKLHFHINVLSCPIGVS